MHHRIFTLTTLLLVSILASCGQPMLDFDDPVGVPGIYTDTSGYVIFIRTDGQYRLCDMQDCIDGKWKYQTDKVITLAEKRALQAAEPSTYINMKPYSRQILLIDIYKTKLGLRMEYDVAAQQEKDDGGTVDLEEVMKLYKEYYVHYRMNNDPSERFSLSTTVRHCVAPLILAPCLGFGYRNDGFRKVASFK
jgi:hypothetical protein